MNVSTFLFSNFDIQIIKELDFQFKKLNFQIEGGNTARFELLNDEKIKSYLRIRDAQAFQFQLCNIVREVWHVDFVKGRMGPGLFNQENTSFTYVTWNDDHILRITGATLNSGKYEITIECEDKHPSSQCTIS
jgi:hypothetical protein